MALPKDLARVEYDYSPQYPDSDELTLKVGEIVEIVSRENEADGWLTGELRGVLGVFPASHVKAVVAPPPPPPPGFNGPPVPIATNQQANLPQISPNNVDIRLGEAPTGPAAPNTMAATNVKLGSNENVRRRQTLICLYAHYSALMSGAFYAFTGVALLCWGGWGFAPYRISSNPRDYTAIDAAIGFWAFVAGFLIILYEVRYGLARGGVTRVPWRGMAYAVITIPGMFALPTAVGGGTLLITAAANCYSSYLGEFYRPPMPARKPKKVSDGTEDLDRGSRWLACLGGRNPDRQVPRIIFMLAYIAANLLVGIFNAKTAYDAIEAAKDFNDDNHRNPKIPPVPDRLYQSYWVVLAKFFGGVMNLNYSIIVIPVSHSLIRWFVDNSRTRAWYAYVLRFVLWFFPVDDAIKLHKIIAWTAFTAAIGHTAAHLFNYVQRAELVWDTFGAGIWVTGICLVMIIFIVYPATFVAVKRGHFEIFWITHMLYVPLFILTIIHGKGMLGPNYWKFFIGPGTIYLMERIYREFTTRLPVKVISATFMSNSVLSIVVAKSGALAHYTEGQYAYICCPAISSLQWHPFTISSAPQEDSVSFHIRVQQRGSWTFRLREFFRVLGAGTNKACLKLAHLEDGRAVPGLIDGPSGLPLLRIHGPYSAPTQHFCEYNEVLVAASGIGATPLASALKSIAHFRWRYSLDRAFPDCATFVWVVAHKEIPSFRWLVRTIKEAEDALADLKAKSGAEARSRRLKFRIYITSYNKAETERYLRQAAEESGADEAGLWGLSYHSTNETVTQAKVEWSEKDIYAAMMDPKEGTVSFGNVDVTLGRPKWDEIFSAIQDTTVEKDVGVTFCGNPLVGYDIKTNCLRYSYKDGGKVTYHLHKEVF